MHYCLIRRFWLLFRSLQKIHCWKHLGADSDFSHFSDHFLRDNIRPVCCQISSSELHFVDNLHLVRVVRSFCHHHSIRQRNGFDGCYFNGCCGHCFDHLCLHHQNRFHNVWRASVRVWNGCDCGIHYWLLFQKQNVPLDLVLRHCHSLFDVFGLRHSADFRKRRIGAPSGWLYFRRDESLPRYYHSIPRNLEAFRKKLK